MTLRLIGVWSIACLLTMATGVMAQTSRTNSTGGVSQLSPTQATSLSGNTGTSAASGASGTSTTARAGSTGGASQMGAGDEPQFNAADGSLGDQVGQGGFTGRSNMGFAGNRNAGQGANAGMTPQFNQFGNTQQNNTQRGSGSGNLKRARPQQRIAFTYPKANLERTRVELSDRFKRLETVSGAETTISEDGVATLTGTVKDDDSRKLAEALARLEPGVRSIKNELQVTSPTP